MARDGEDAKREQEEARRRRKREMDAGVKRILTLLETTRRALLAEVADTDWDRFVLPRLTAAVDRQLEHWRDVAAAGLRADQGAVWNLAQTSTSQLLTSIGVDVSLPELPTSLLQALQDRAGQRIGGLTASAKEKIDRLLTTSLLSGASRDETIKGLGRILKVGAVRGARPEGLFGSIGARAEFIYRHEVGTAFATAQDQRREQATQYVPELRKVWVHDGHPSVPREDHVAMHGQERRQDEPFVNPMTGEALLFPRDPAADISETANCTCDVFLWRPEFGSKAEFIGPATGETAEAA